MSALSECLGEVLVAVTEDRCRFILHFENGKSVELYPHGPDSELKAEQWHQAGCVRRLAVAGKCSCLIRGGSESWSAPEQTEEPRG